MSIFGWSSYDEWKTTEPPDMRDPADYCPECEKEWSKCKCEPDEPDTCHHGVGFDEECEECAEEEAEDTL